MPNAKWNALSTVCLRSMIAKSIGAICVLTLSTKAILSCVRSPFPFPALFFSCFCCSSLPLFAPSFLCLYCFLAVSLVFVFLAVCLVFVFLFNFLFRFFSKFVFFCLSSRRHLLFILPIFCLCSPVL